MGRLVCIGSPRRRRGIESIGMVCMTRLNENRFDFAWATFRDGYLSRAYLSWLIEVNRLYLFLNDFSGLMNGLFLNEAESADIINVNREYFEIRLNEVIAVRVKGNILYYV